MQLMTRLIRQYSSLGEAEEVWLARLVNEWQLIADLSFSDLVLWVPSPDPDIFWAVAQIRPTTGPTALEHDVAGERIAHQQDHPVSEAYWSGQVVGTSDNQLQAGVPVDILAVPVHRCGRVIAVVERHTNRMGVRAPGSLDENYMQLADGLMRMLERGEFPIPGKPSDAALSPRAGDGLIRLDKDLVVQYATPNAVTAYRRMGLAADLEGENLGEMTLSLMEPAARENAENQLQAARGSREVTETDVSVGMISVRLRILPVRDENGPNGAVVLCRDVTELHKRERELVTKDATIREIHHRVKNNLQTVAALLRMQGRRIKSPEARAALNEAMSRVSAIAVVHETLSQAFDDEVAFDDVADRVLKMVGEVAGSLPSGHLRTRREGSFGKIPAETATSLSLVVTELCQNAIEHGLSGSDVGSVRVVARRSPDELEVLVIDDGAGLPEGFSLQSSRSLGLSIVSTLMSDLGGTFSLDANDEGTGSTARITLPLRMELSTSLD